MGPWSFLISFKYWNCRSSPEEQDLPFHSGWKVLEACSGVIKGKKIVSNSREILSLLPLGFKEPAKCKTHSGAVPWTCIYPKKGRLRLASSLLRFWLLLWGGSIFLKNFVCLRKKSESCIQVWKDGIFWSLLLNSYTVLEEKRLQGRFWSNSFSINANAFLTNSIGKRSRPKARTRDNEYDAEE